MGGDEKMKMHDVGRPKAVRMWRRAEGVAARRSAKQLRAAFACSARISFAAFEVICRARFDYWNFIPIPTLEKTIQCSKSENS